MSLDLNRSEALSLNPNPLVSLFSILLVDGTFIPLTQRGPLTFQGITYIQYNLSLSGEASNSSGEKTRPRLTLVNPDGVLSVLARSNKLEGAKVVRNLVLAGDNGFDLVQVDLWFLFQVTALNRQLVEVELRGIGDFPQTLIPPRKYYPPEFNHVSL